MMILMTKLWLSDPGLQAEDKEQLTQTIYAMPREPIPMGRPEFPEIFYQCRVEMRPQVSTLVTSATWLIFDILKLMGKQEWLQLPSNTWPV